MLLWGLSETNNGRANHTTGTAIFQNAGEGGGGGGGRRGRGEEGEGGGGGGGLVYTDRAQPPPHAVTRGCVK